MNPDAANIVADGLLKGAFDVVDTMFSLSSHVDRKSPSDADANGVAKALLHRPVVLLARLRTEFGAVALLIDTLYAARIAALAQDKPAPAEAALSPVDRAILSDVAESMLGGGVAGLMQRLGRQVEKPTGVSVPESMSAGELLSILGQATQMPFDYRSGESHGEGVLLFSQALEALTPAGHAIPAGKPGDLARQAALSPDEIGSILSGFDPDAIDNMGGYGTPAPPPLIAPALSGNMDLVLDIRLTATARLGRVEMPLGDILALGPGSVIDVGQTVDEPVDLLINDKLIARGDVVVVDEKFGLRITEIVSQRERIESLR